MKKIALPSLKKMTQLLRWGAYALVCLLGFTFFKFPNERLYPYLEAPLVQFLSNQGISFTAEKRELSWLFLSYQLSQVKGYFPPPHRTQEIRRIQFSIALWPLLLGRFGGTLLLETDTGKLKIKGAFNPQAKGSLSFEAKNFDLETLGIGALVSFPFSCLLSEASGNIEGDLFTPHTLNGKMSLNLQRLVIPAQKWQGFSIPTLDAQSGKMDLVLASRQMQIKTFQLGALERFPEGDEVVIKGTGDIKLLNSWSQSQPRIDLELWIAEKALKSISILELLLAESKQAEQHYAFSLGGTFGNLETHPGKQKEGP